jgi:hypothetical protein
VLARIQALFETVDNPCDVKKNNKLSQIKKGPWNWWHSKSMSSAFSTKANSSLNIPIQILLTAIALSIVFEGSKVITLLKPGKNPEFP